MQNGSLILVTSKMENISSVLEYQVIVPNDVQNLRSKLHADVYKRDTIRIKLVVVNVFMRRIL